MTKVTGEFYRLICFAQHGKRENLSHQGTTNSLTSVKCCKYHPIFAGCTMHWLVTVIIVPICLSIIAFGSSGLWNAGKTFRSQEDLFGLQSWVAPSPARKSEIFLEIIADSLEHVYASLNLLSAPSMYYNGPSGPWLCCRAQKLHLH